MTTITKDTLKNLSQEPGVYKYLDQNGKVLYIGKAKNLKKRINSYFKQADNTLIPNPRNSQRIQIMISQAHSLHTTIVESEQDALILENTLIKQIKPKYNILLRDDKTYPYILLDTAAHFPRFEFSRQVKNRPHLKYFGPYPSGCRSLLKALYDLFPLVQKTGCLKHKKACLFYQINKCHAPCEGKITKQEYDKIINTALLFLQNKKKLLKALETKMLDCSNRLLFEKAKDYKEMIEAITPLANFSQINTPKPYNLDINEQWETAKDLVNRVLNYKSVNISKKDIMQPFSFDNLSNPLFSNDIVGVVIDKIRDDKFNNDIYDILTGRIRSGSRYKSLDVSTEDLLEYENMNFMIRKKNSHNKKAILLPNKPFKNMHDLMFDKEKYYSKLYGPSYYSYYYQEVDGDPWRYLPSDSKAETTHRIYINIPVKNIVRLAIVLYEKLNQNNVSYRAKFAIYDRDDKMVIYTDEDNCIKAMNVIQNLYSDMPELFDEKYKSSMTTAPTLVPGVGVANEPNSLHTSHNIRMEDVLNWALSITTLKYMINNSNNFINRKNFL